MSFRIATFNAENLLQRHRLISARSNLSSLQRQDEFGFAHQGEIKCRLTAKALAQCRADIICLQEIENIEALVEFDRDYLRWETKKEYHHKILIEGNDGRGIDVAVLARDHTTAGEPIEIHSVTSHAHLSYGDLGLMNDALEDLGERVEERVFRRDCLVVDLSIGGKPLTVIVLHLKSMGTDKVDVDGRAYTMPVRDAECRAVIKILQAKFGKMQSEKSWVICGDLNDYSVRLDVLEASVSEPRFALVNEANTGIEGLLEPEFANNLVDRRDASDRWTLFHSKAPFEHHLVQLDYVLVSPALAEANPDSVPEIIRNGQPRRVIMPEQQNVERYPGTGWDRPKASDHCPVVVRLELP